MRNMTLKLIHNFVRRQRIIFLAFSLFVLVPLGTIYFGSEFRDGGEYQLSLKSLFQIDKVYTKQCDWFQEQSLTKTDMDMLSLVDKLPYDNQYGGAWTQGYEITYDPKQWSEYEKLQVIIVPHSHNDPGWLMTFDQYFDESTKHILDSIVNTLSEKPSRKFVWAETSFLSQWWRQTSEEMRIKMKRLITETKQLEIVTGGWVMADEASSHYYALLEEMISGHEWLKSNIDPSVRPSHGWSIDPFGYSSTMAYLLKQMGFDGMLIQRIHYHLKKHLALSNDLEFIWRQAWSTPNSKDTSIICHAMPFISYGISHSCGPDPDVCCKFDFASGCLPEQITPENIKYKSWFLLDQLRKKSQLYGGDNNHNVVLFPLGNDFTYKSVQEAQVQYENYERLMNYMNYNDEYNVNIRFGTLRDYFDLVNKNLESGGKKMKTFTGDFFTYSDKDNRYWSGYFTSRPFYKKLDRLTEHFLRVAEITYSLSNLIESQQGRNLTNLNDIFKKLLVARHNLGLFQHHDGITGTSRHQVVTDFGRLLYESLRYSREIIENSMSLLMRQMYQPFGANFFNLDDVRLNKELSDTMRYKETIQLTDEEPEARVVLFNSNLNKRVEIVSLRVNTRDVEVLDSQGKALDEIQLSLVWPNMDGGYFSQKSADSYFMAEDDLPFYINVNQDSFELLFQVEMAGLSASSFTIRKTSGSQDQPLSKRYLTNVTYYYSDLEDIDFIKAYQKQKNIEKRLNEKSIYNNISLRFRPRGNGDTIKLDTGTEYTAYFSLFTGYLLKFASKNHTIPANIRLVRYGVKPHSFDRSGAYLFIPDGPSRDLNSSADSSHVWTRVEQNGPFRTRVCTHMKVVTHCVEIYPSLNRAKKFKMPHVNVWNSVDIRKMHNYELAMLVKTNVSNEDVFHTDANGFQFMKRKRQDKLTISGNVYPMASGAFIQDSAHRFTILTAQPLGVTSPASSQLQVFLDRYLDQDDNLGLGEPVNDNVMVSSRFVLMFESVNPAQYNSSYNTFPSLMSSWTSNDLLYPLVKLIVTQPSVAIRPERRFAEKQYPCDLHLVNFRTMQREQVTFNGVEKPVIGQTALILHRLPYDENENCFSRRNTVKSSPYYTEYCQLKNFFYANFEFKSFFDSFMNTASMRVQSCLLNLNDRNSSTWLSKSDIVIDFIQPHQIEAFKIMF